jgi:DNA integrity scanning protein DisA with diadenylate cyclase activity/mannitol/fructose-specific phosphotransferase system IIA component (Ntr-type)
MRLDRIVAKNRIIDLKSKDFGGAIEELLKNCPLEDDAPRKIRALKKDLRKREDAISSYLGNGVALPHSRTKLSKNYILAVGRCSSGLIHNGQHNQELRLVFLLLVSESAPDYLNTLATLARIFQNKPVIDKLIGEKTLPNFRDSVKKALAGEPVKSRYRTTRFNSVILNEAKKIAKGTDCSSILIFGDTFSSPVQPVFSFKDFSTVLVLQSDSDVVYKKDEVDSIITLRSRSETRLSQLRSAVLIGLIRGLFNVTERILCIGGIPGSNQFDTLVVVDVGNEFVQLINTEIEILPPDVSPEVLERVLGIAVDLSVEGREGRPVGALFVLGDSDVVKNFVTPLILNPFHGYKDEDRNILNPFMDETVKELASIDGAFVIQGTGVLESAGTLVNVPHYKHELPGGFGSRHAAAAAISSVSDCLAITVSSSTGQVVLFREGDMIPLNRN